MCPGLLPTAWHISISPHPTPGTSQWRATATATATATSHRNPLRTRRRRINEHVIVNRMGGHGEENTRGRESRESRGRQGKHTSTCGCLSFSVFLSSFAVRFPIVFATYRSPLFLMASASYLILMHGFESSSGFRTATSFCQYSHFPYPFQRNRGTANHRAIP